MERTVNMFWFKKKRDCPTDNECMTVEHKLDIKKSAEAIQEAKDQTIKLNKALQVDDEVSFNIYLAIGGKDTRGQK